MCSGQTPAAQSSADTPRTGAMERQLAPGLLDQMPACAKRDATLDPALALAAPGTINAKGDCEWPTGVTCHFHVGAEFVASSGPRPKVDELHCIVPSGDAKSPRVFGTHFTCKAGTVSHDHDVHPGQACGDKLLTALAAAMDTCNVRCCDDGTLTTTTDERRTAGNLDVRPDFRICAATTELDCSALANMVGHPANAPRFGAPLDEPAL